MILNGTEVNRLKEKELSAFRNQQIGFVFQFHQLLPEFTALENVMIPAFISGASSGDAMKRAKETLDFLGLAERASHKPAELSGGEKQRVAVARALINSPAVILADEPSGSLDTRNKEELHQLFFDLRDKLGQTFVIVTHDETLAKLTDRTIHMVDAKISIYHYANGLWIFSFCSFHLSTWNPPVFPSSSKTPSMLRLMVVLVPAVSWVDSFC